MWPVDFDHFCPVGQSIPSGTPFSLLAGLYCHGSVRAPEDALSLSDQRELHTWSQGWGQGKHGKLDSLPLISMPVVINRRLHSQAEGLLSHSGTGFRPAGLQSSAELASSGRHRTSRKKWEEMWSFRWFCIWALFTLQLSKPGKFNCWENNTTYIDSRIGNLFENEK